MPTAADSSVTLSVDEGGLRLSGELDFATVGQVLERGREAVCAKTGHVTVLDLTAVTKSDSAGLALVIDWLRAARARQVQLELRGIPAQMADIARISGLGELMGVGDEADAA